MKLLRTALLLCLAACTAEPAPFGACPSEAQLRWQRMEMNLFCHFGPNTFTGVEWGDGTEPETLFNPEALDCRQWARIARAGGFGGIILTAKHHDGFCLWPNPESTHTVSRSTWRDGRGDVLADLSEACAAEGIGFGLYISPWDRNDPRYGSPAYNEAFRNTLRSALGHYGPVFEQWFDGANGEGPAGKRQVYDWPSFHETVYGLQPDAIIFSDTGPGCRWVGNEAGMAAETNWSTLSPDGFEPGAGAPPTDTLQQGNLRGARWIPAEADVSIRPGWFWREAENSRVKTLEELLQIYYGSVGRNALLLLNVPPDVRGRIHEADSARLAEFRQALDTIFAEDLAQGARVSADCVRGRKFRAANLLRENGYWAAPDGTDSAVLTLELDGEKTFNRVLLQEQIALGQRIGAFRVEARRGGAWQPLAQGTTVGYKRILCTETVTADAVRITITHALACPTLARAGLYFDPYL